MARRIKGNKGMLLQRRLLQPAAPVTKGPPKLEKQNAKWTE